MILIIVNEILTFLTIRQELIPDVTEAESPLLTSG